MTSSNHRSIETPQSVPTLETPSAPSPSSAPKEASARVLKKRESDRRCQRIKRERTKSKIAALEEKVRSFGNQDSTGQIQLLIRQLQSVERERDDLAKKVTIIESVIHEGRETRQTKTDDHPAPESVASPIAETPEHKYTDPSGRVSGGHQKIVPHSNVSSGNTSSFGGVSSAGTTSESFAAEAPVVCPQLCSYPGPSQDTTQCECCAVESVPTKRPRFNTWRFVNEVLSSRFEWPDYCRLIEDEHRDDTPVRAVVEGWGTIGASGPMHPSWQILRKIDQTILGKCRPKERIAVITAVQLLLLSHVKAESVPGVPQFYERRPSQDMADSYAIHFFPWPGMRERFVFYQHRYCTNEFWDSFISGLTLLWPYELRDCYTKNVDTGLYGISPLFLEHIDNINCWAMDIDVFRKWPELSADIPAYNRIPQSVSNWGRLPRLTGSVSARTAQANSNRRAKDLIPVTQRLQPSQVYVQPAVMTGSTYYSPQTSFYNPGEKPMAVMSWTEDHTPQPPSSLDYFDHMVNPVNVVPSF